MTSLTETLYRGHVHRVPASLNSHLSLESRRSYPVITRTPTHQEIAELAYSYWEARDRRHGSALEDWLRAERNLMARFAR